MTGFDSLDNALARFAAQAAEAARQQGETVLDIFAELAEDNRLDIHGAIGSNLFGATCHCALPEASLPLVAHLARAAAQKAIAADRRAPIRLVSHRHLEEAA